MEKVIQAAVQNHVTIEISARYHVPSPAFIEMARKAGARFSFGTNNHGEDAGVLDYCLRVVKECNLSREDVFTPEPHE